MARHVRGICESLERPQHQRRHRRTKTPRGGRSAIDMSCASCGKARKGKEQGTLANGRLSFPLSSLLLLFFFLLFSRISARESHAPSSPPFAVTTKERERGGENQRQFMAAHRKADKQGTSLPMAPMVFPLLSVKMRLEFLWSSFSPIRDLPFFWMRVARNLAADDHDGRVELAPENSKGPSKKGKRRQKKALRAVQRLFETCKQVFSEGGPAGIIPSPEDVERLRSLLDTLKPGDVGLSLNLPYFQNFGIDGPPPVTYLHLYECPNFSIGIFCLPQAAAIPLHNHPRMTVFSKILLGSMHIKSYDWVTQGLNENIKSSSGACLAKMNTDTVFTAPCRTSVLYPTSGGNLHCFTAVTSCAVLDVLGPPYNDDEGRTCTYYKQYALSTFPGDETLLSGKNEEYAWLEERGSKPDDLVVRGAEYRGPKIVDR